MRRTVVPLVEEVPERPPGAEPVGDRSRNDEGSDRTEPEADEDHPEPCERDDRVEVPAGMHVMIEVGT